MVMGTTGKSSPDAPRHPWPCTGLPPQAILAWARDGANVSGGESDATDVPVMVRARSRRARGLVGVMAVAAAMQLANASLVNALIDRATHDRLPLLPAAGGRGDASDERVFPYVFTIPTHFWSLNTAKIRFIGQRAGPEGDVGTAHWMRGMLRALLTTEALRTAMRHFGNQPLTGAQMQWGLEHLSLTPAALKELGAEGLLPPITLSCRDHEGGGGVKFQQWDGTQWTVLTDWMAPDQALVRPLVEASAAKYAQEKGITPRDCP